MRNFEILDALRWFYEHELELFNLEKKDEKTDEENIKYLQLSSQMKKSLTVLQKGLKQPCKEIYEKMETRLEAMLEILAERNARLGTQEEEGNHILFLRKAIPRAKKNLERLADAKTIPELKVAVDIIVNEFHWGFPMIKHITRHIGAALDMDEEEKDQFRTLTLEIKKLRDELFKKRKK